MGAMVYSQKNCTNKVEINTTDLQSGIAVLNREIEDAAIRDLIKNFTLGDVSALIHDITLPTSYADVVKIEWESSDENVITSTGHITRPAVGSPMAHATLTAHFSTSTVSDQLSFEVGVLPLFTDAEALQYELDHLTIGGNVHNLYDHLTLPTVAAEGDPVFWISNDTSYLSNDGRVVRLGTDGKQHVTRSTPTSPTPLISLSISPPTITRISTTPSLATVITTPR